jgi:hypothetical protein
MLIWAALWSQVIVSIKKKVFGYLVLAEADSLAPARRVSRLWAVHDMTCIDSFVCPIELNI